MARKLDEQQLSEFAAFLQALFELGGFPSDAEWARQSGVHAVNLSDARRGKSQLDGFNLLRLIRVAADRARMTPEQIAVVTARLEEATSDPVMELRLRLEELALMVSEGLARVAADASPAAEQPPGGESQDPKEATP